MGGSCKLQNKRRLISLSIISFAITLHHDPARSNLNYSICGGLGKALSLCGNDTLELSLSSEKQWARCECNVNHSISETLVKCRDFAETLTVCSCCFRFHTQFSLHRAALAEGYCISVLASNKTRKEGCCVFVFFLIIVIVCLLARFK